MDAVEVWDLESVKWMVEDGGEHGKKIDADTNQLVDFTAKSPKLLTFCRNILVLMKGSHWKMDPCFQGLSQMQKKLQAVFGQYIMSTHISYLW